MPPSDNEAVVLERHVRISLLQADWGSVELQEQTSAHLGLLR